MRDGKGIAGLPGTRRALPVLCLRPRACLGWRSSPTAAAGKLRIVEATLDDRTGTPVVAPNLLLSPAKTCVMPPMLLAEGRTA
jgi:hypothetical protein